jgi:hypothetical protein
LEVEEQTCNAQLPKQLGTESNSIPESTGGFLSDDLILEATADLDVNLGLVLGTTPLELGSIGSELTFGPCLDVLNIPEELRFILQYRE